MSNNNYLFYDLETSGLSKSFDQIFRFAAIQTDANLKEIKRYEISIKLRPDIIPSPEALHVTRLGISDIIDNGLCEFEGIKEIHKIFNQPNLITLGYNSIKFDNEFLRYGFYRNLLDPYSHQYSNGNFKADVMSIALIYFLFKKDALKWPIKNDIPSLKLENINAENRLVDGVSHDAMVDVEVTLELSRKLRNYDIHTWNYLINGFKKSEDNKRLSLLPPVSIFQKDYRHGLVADLSIGYKLNCIAPILILGTHLEYDNQIMLLRLDLDMNNPQFIKRKISEPSFIVPYNSKYSFTMNEDRIDTTNKNLKLLCTHPEFLPSIIDQALNQVHDSNIDIDIDATLYTLDFLTSNEKNQAKTFHSLEHPDRLDMLNNLDDGRIKRLIKRIMIRNYPDTMSSEFLNKIYTDEFSLDTTDLSGEKHLTSQVALDRIFSIKNTKDSDATQIKILDEYEKYLRGISEN